MYSLITAPARKTVPVSIHASSEAVCLLANVIAQLRGVDQPIVQFVPASCDLECRGVVRDFTVAAVARLGRTLLLTFPDNRPTMQELGGNGASSNIARLRNPYPTAFTPDSLVPGLYYKILEEDQFDLPSFPSDDKLANDQNFKMMVVESMAPSQSPVTLAQAGSCHGTILMVAAGLSRLDDIQATARKLRHAGGTLFGTILFNAPSIRRRFFLSGARHAI